MQITWNLLLIGVAYVVLGHYAAKSRNAKNLIFGQRAIHFSSTGGKANDLLATTALPGCIPLGANRHPALPSGAGGVRRGVGGEAMPIATVRIAPVEQWCPEARNHPAAPLDIVGHEVQIVTESRNFWNIKGAYWYNPNACDGAYWDVTKESAEKLGHHSRGGIMVLCEHMLEMD